MNIVIYGSGSVHVSLLPAYIQVLHRRLEVDISIVLSTAAHRFVSGEALCTLTARPVHGPIDDVGPLGIPRHVELAEWADLVLVLPATANTLAKLANGFSCDLGAAVVLAASCPVVVAPAMRRSMYEKAAVRRNLATLEADGARVLRPGAYPAVGQRAGGADLGDEGMSPSPSQVLEFIEPLCEQRAAS
ncbi:flavoprotein [uncultured Nocardioides sp.]|uniref:flavoprotein n=1 Tax=uncultured Nocardioides sp. TaxID=198441 RepID=UPI0026211FA6|nr:flavoprotein [uncultured Nocardioides sp.]